MLAPVALTAACVGDNHSGYTFYYETTKYLQYDSEKHQVLVTTYKKCSCGNNVIHSAISTTVAHGTTKSELGLHIAGRHILSKVCISCGGIVSTTYVNCSGPPCMVLY